jgi:hypothetical protein
LRAGSVDHSVPPAPTRALPGKGGSLASGPCFRVRVIRPGRWLLPPDTGLPLGFPLRSRDRNNGEAA